MVCSYIDRLFSSEQTMAVAIETFNDSLPTLLNAKLGMVILVVI